MEADKINAFIDKKFEEYLTSKANCETSKSQIATLCSYLKKMQDLEDRLTEKDVQLKTLINELNTSKEHIKQYCNISERSEKELKILNDEYEKYKLETGTKLSENMKKIQQLEEKCSELEAELLVYANSALKNELQAVKEELNNVLTDFDNCKCELDAARTEITKLSEAVQKAEEKYTDEMILHSSDIQTLSQVKDEWLKAQNQLNEIAALKNSTKEKMEAEKSSWMPQQAVAMVMPRIEQPTAGAPPALAPPVAGGVSASPTSASAAPGVSTSHASPAVSTSHAPPDARPPKRRLRQRPVTAKRTRVQGFERSVEVEYPVPTSSRCDQDDECVIVLDSEEDDERCTGTMYRESPAQSLEAGGVGDEGDSEPPAHYQVEVISSGSEQGEGESREWEESRGDEEATAVSSQGSEPSSPQQESPAQSHEAGGVGDEGDSEPPAHHQVEVISSGSEQGEGESREWEESRGDEEATAVSSQGSEPSSPQQVAEEARPRRSRRLPALSPLERWRLDADSVSRPRGRGRRSRGRPSRRSHCSRY